MATDHDADLMSRAAGALGRAGLTALPGEFTGWLVFGPKAADADLDRFDTELRAHGLAVGDVTRPRPDGTRTVTVYRPRPTATGPDGREVCPTCRGEGGTAPLRGPGTCPDCHGLCWLRDSEGAVTCPTCNGDAVRDREPPCPRRCGGRDDDCPDCGGEGTLAREAACRRRQGDGDVSCPRGCTPATSG